VPIFTSVDRNGSDSATGDSPAENVTHTRARLSHQNVNHIKLMVRENLNLNRTELVSRKNLKTTATEILII
jgi:hypothetical protein